MLLIGILFTSCGGGNGLRLSQAYTIEQMQPAFPNGLKAYTMVGHNWFEGSYKGRPVLIHFVHTIGDVNVYFQFIDGGKE